MKDLESKAIAFWSGGLILTAVGMFVLVEGLRHSVAPASAIGGLALVAGLVGLFVGIRDEGRVKATDGQGDDAEPASPAEKKG